MNRSLKLVLVAVFFVLGSAALALVLQRDNVPEELPAPSKKRGQLVQELIDFQPSPEDLPDEAKQVQTYLDERWPQFEDEGIVAAGIDPNGGQFYVSKRAIVGRSGDGKPLYAQSIMRAHRFEGPVFKYKDSPLRSHAAVKVDRKTPGNLMQRLPKGKASKIPLDQVPGGDWGDLGKLNGAGPASPPQKP